MSVSGVVFRLIVVVYETVVMLVVVVVVDGILNRGLGKAATTD